MNFPAFTKCPNAAGLLYIDIDKTILGAILTFSRHFDIFIYLQTSQLFSLPFPFKNFRQKQATKLFPTKMAKSTKSQDLIAKWIVVEYEDGYLDTPTNLKKALHFGMIELTLSEPILRASIFVPTSEKSSAQKKFPVSTSGARQVLADRSPERRGRKRGRSSSHYSTCCESITL